MKSSRIIAVTIFSVAMVAAVWIGGKYFNKARGHAKTVSVVGKADRDFTSDLIVWRLSYNLLNTDMKQGYTQIKNISNSVRDYLKSKGIKDEEMEFLAINCSEETEYHWDEAARRGITTFSGYRLGQTVRIESSDVDKVEKISVPKPLPRVLVHALVDCRRPTWVCSKSLPPTLRMKTTHGAAPSTPPPRKNVPASICVSPTM